MKSFRMFGFGVRVAMLSAFIVAATVVGPAAALAATDQPAPQTLRLDYYHTGNAENEVLSLDRVVVEPLPWPGNLQQQVDTSNLGKYLFEVRQEGEVLYSRGFASIYGEWETTAEAKTQHRTFHESLRFPRPIGVVEVVIYKRGADQEFRQLWQFEVDPEGRQVDPSALPRLELIEIQRSGDPAEKVDVLFLGDGYRADERHLFVAKARRLAEVLFSFSPFKERRSDFNIWGLCPAAAESGVSRPSTGIHRRSPVAATYDAFGSERYILTFDNRAWRDLAAWAPYEFVEILVHGETYGGGGIFGQFATVAAGNAWAEYVFVHEFGHHFAALADEYYTSAVAYEVPEDRPEPWEKNATALHDPEQLKWAALATPGTPIPTPWPKEEFELLSNDIQSRRRQLRAERQPESAMSALFEEQSRREGELFQQAEHRHATGAFEGANYAARGYYRPALDCVMFSRNDVPFCPVCQHALTEIIDLYSEAR